MFCRQADVGTQAGEVEEEQMLHSIWLGNSYFPTRISQLEFLGRLSDLA